MSDALWSGRRFRTFNVLDDFNREALRIEVYTSLPSARIIRALDESIELCGKPRQVRMDNGPEIISDAFARWAKRHAIELLFIQPGKPMQNGYIERFNRTYREEVLNAYVFETLDEVRRMTGDWLTRYNGHRPHESLGNPSPRQYLMANLPSTPERSSEIRGLHKHFEAVVGSAEIAGPISASRNSCTPDVCIPWIQVPFRRVSASDGDTGPNAALVLSTMANPTFRVIDCDT